MADNDPVRLRDWASGRPVKKSDRKAEQRYASRQERTRVGLRLLNENAEALRVWAAKNKRDQQDLVDELLVSYFRMDAQTPTDQIKIDDQDDEVKHSCGTSSSSIGSGGRPDAQPLSNAELLDLPELEREALVLYQQVTGNTLRHYDRAAFAEVAHHARHHILAGIGVSKVRSNGRRIRGFRYFHGAIAEVASDRVGPEYLQHVMRCLRQLSSQPNLPTIGAEVKEFEGEVKQ
jgi:hypothetical protein